MIRRLGELNSSETGLYGGKALVLDKLIKTGLRIPEGLVISTDFYLSFIRETGIDDFLVMNIEKKVISDMRWEEVWDLAQRIRHRFFKTRIPAALKDRILQEIKVFHSKPVVVRSSSPSEDSSTASFAGLHDSIVGVKGSDAILTALKEVWSSFWSDRALIYTREMNLNPEHSAMAVIVQELIKGDCSGVMFTRKPGDRTSLIIESVEGLNEKLVSGAAEPDRFTLNRKDGQIREIRRAADSKGINWTPPLDDLLRTAYKLEDLFGDPQDIEWTVKDDLLFLLQSRPITTADQQDKPLWVREDKRAWYRSLRKNLSELKQLQHEIETDFMQGLDDLSRKLSQQDFGTMGETALLKEIAGRKTLLAEWEKSYWEICIPFAHGVRIFGEIYNLILEPATPFEFVDLLINQDLMSIERNRKLSELAERLYNDGVESSIFQKKLSQFMDSYGQSSFFNGLLFDDRAGFIEFLKAFRDGQSRPEDSRRLEQLEKNYLEKMIEAGREDGPLLLDMGRISYKLRDDDNIMLGKLRGELYRAEAELNQRRPEAPKKKSHTNPPVDIPGFRVTYRQVTGACASPGFARGRARILKKREDLFNTRKGEIIVCDSIDPNITFVIPLASGIVERRGGMLVHGAIIAREYRIPCITGVRDAVEIIHDGDYITVDAYNGIVVIEAEQSVD